MKKGTKHTKESIRKNSLSHKGLKSRLGAKLSEETKRKISESEKGKIISLETRKKMSVARIGDKNPMWGKKRLFSIEWRKKQSEAKKGAKSPLWRGGKMANYPEKLRIRNSNEYKLWRKAVYKRDNFTCQKYGTGGGDLIAHHINNFNDFPELRLAIDNGITLSEKAHIEFHKKYGKHNNTREQLNEFLYG